MLYKLFGLINKVFYKIRFGSNVCFDGIPTFVQHMSLYVRSGNIKIGKKFRMNQGVYMAALNGGEISIGNNVSINRNCILVCHDSISIADGCAIGPNTVFYDHDHKFGESGIESGFKTTPIVIEKNCWIGAGVTILRGTHIGEGSVIGAGSVIRGEIPAHSLVTSGREIKVSPIEKRNKDKLLND